MDLGGRCAVVVGTRRMGRAIALQLASLGMEVGILYRSSHDEANRLARKLDARVVFR